MEPSTKSGLQRVLATTYQLWTSAEVELWTSSVCPNESEEQPQNDVYTEHTWIKSAQRLIFQPDRSTDRQRSDDCGCGGTVSFRPRWVGRPRRQALARQLLRRHQTEWTVQAVNGIPNPPSNKSLAHLR